MRFPKIGYDCTHPGQLPFGYDYQDYRLVRSEFEQRVILLMGRARAGGLSLRQIAGQLNYRLIPSKNGIRRHSADSGTGAGPSMYSTLWPHTGRPDQR